MPTVKKLKTQNSKVKTTAQNSKVQKTVVKKEVKELPKQTGLKISVYNTSGKKLESITLPKEIFNAKINNNLMAQAIRVYLANQRRGTVKTKSRGEVKISTRKIYRQKGTGRARHGAASAPIFVGGGIAFGPRPRDYSLKLNKKAKRLAFFSALTTKLKDGEIKIVSGFEKLEPKTKKMAKVISSLSLNNKNLLLVTPSIIKATDQKSSVDFNNVVKAARNIEGVSIFSANLLNTYEVLKSKNIVFMKAAIDSLKENFLKS